MSLPSREGMRPRYMMVPGMDKSIKVTSVWRSKKKPSRSGNNLERRRTYVGRSKPVQGYFKLWRKIVKRVEFVI